MRERGTVTDQLLSDAARDMQDVAWREAQLDLYGSVMRALTRLGFWIFLMTVLLFANALGVAYLIWKGL